ncbi:MAG: PQQ-dependent sugar dehydrogenase [Saprospiraceae bacterium]
MLKHLLCCIVLIINLIYSTESLAQLPEGFAQVRVAERLDPTAMTMAPDGRIFITEKNGNVRIVRDAQLLPDPFLTLTVDNFNERGLGGIALDPDFERNHFVYLFYTVPGANRNRISRFTANGDYAIPGSEKIILELDPLAGTIHNGGAMAFGPDGKLYLSVGDGANSGTAQNLNSLSGKILRINTDGSIPEDNPFYNQSTGLYRAIWALGFRNAFTFSFQPGTGRLFANDVGGSDFEEVNDVVKGGNYGWDRIEGPRRNQLPPEQYREPLYAYGRAQGCCIIGSAFYNPALATFPPPYHGKYFFADYCNGWMRVLNPDNGQVESTFMTGLNQLVQILVAPEGDLYYLMRSGIGGGGLEDNTSTNNGSLWRVFYEGSGAPFIAVHPQTVTVPIGEDAIFQVQASGKAPLRYEWSVNEQVIANNDSATFIFSNAQLADDGKKVRCTVKNAQGEVFSTEAVLYVTANTRPNVLITSPNANATYRAGEVLNFVGIGTDPEDGTLTPDNLSWKIDFHHDDHLHPALDPTPGIAAGTFSIPRIGEISDNVFYRIHLTATDKGGLTRTTYRDVLPVKTQFTVVTQPPGLQINVDGKTAIAPVTVTSVEGIRRTIGAPAVQTIGNKLYFFKDWHNNSPEDFFTFLAGEQTSITARYEEANLAIGDGTGLLGNYYQFNQNTAPDVAFDTPPLLTRVDSTINFNWVFEAPAAGIRPDYFAVRWTGKIMPPLTGTYTFHTITDDGVRLWVNNQLIINQWIPQPETEHRGTITLEAGKRYPIRMEFHDLGAHAVARLQWSMDKLPRQVVPKTQLFPERSPKIPPGSDYDIRLTPNPANSVINLEIDTRFADAVIWQVFDAQGRSMLRGKASIEIGANVFELPLANFATGTYFVEITGSNRIKATKKFIKH